MLRSVKQLYGDSLRASDGDIGHIRDFYFDDQKWGIRYVVVDTGSWLSDRLVLISPHVLRNFDLDGVCRGVNLTRQQIENSPDFDSHKPVSRQYEEQYYRYYGWPSYWEGSGLWGLGAFPMVEAIGNERLDGAPAEPLSSDGPGDPHLRSTQALSGYHIQNRRGEKSVTSRNFIVHRA